MQLVKRNVNGWNGREQPSNPLIKLNCLCCCVFLLKKYVIAFLRSFTEIDLLYCRWFDESSLAGPVKPKFSHVIY